MNKELVINALNELEESFSMDEFIEKLFFKEKVEIGLMQSENGLTISDEELDERVNQWLV